MVTKAYCLADFIICCMIGSQNVYVLFDAELNARLQFGLKTKAELLAFIGNGGLQNMVYLKTEPWRNNPPKRHYRDFH